MKAFQIKRYSQNIHIALNDISNPLFIRNHGLEANCRR